MQRDCWEQSLPCRSPAREVLLLWPMCRDAQVSRAQDAQERQKSPKPFFAPGLCAGFAGSLAQRLSQKVLRRHIHVPRRTRSILLAPLRAWTSPACFVTCMDALMPQAQDAQERPRLE